MILDFEMCWDKLLQHSLAKERKRRQKDFSNFRVLSSGGDFQEGHTVYQRGLRKLLLYAKVARQTE